MVRLRALCAAYDAHYKPRALTLALFIVRITLVLYCAHHRALLIVGVMAAHAFGEGSGVGVSFSGRRGHAQVRL